MKKIVTYVVSFMAVLFLIFGVQTAFATDPKIIVKDYETTSIDLTATNLPPNASVSFSIRQVIVGPDSSRYGDPDSKVVTSDATGTAEALFFNLKAGEGYHVDATYVSGNAPANVTFDFTAYDMSSLTGMISSSLNDLSAASNIKEGTDAGQYKVGSKKVFSDAIVAASALKGLKDLKTNQAEIDAASATLSAAKTAFDNGQVKTVTQTAQDANLTIQDYKTISITLISARLPSDTPVKFLLTRLISTSTDGTPLYGGDPGAKETRTDKDGNAQASFIGLVPGAKYHGNVSYTISGNTLIPATLDFTAFDLTALDAAIDSGTTLYQNAIEGTAPGQYPAGSKDTLLAAINAANEINHSPNLSTFSSQTDADAALKTLNQAITDFQAKKILVPSGSSATGSGIVSSLFNTSLVVPNCNRGTAVNADKTGLGTPCDFNYLMVLINNVIKFLLFTIATPLVALIICYVGFILLTSGGSSEKMTKAKHILFNVVLGYIVGLAAWLIVNTIVHTLGFTGDSFLKQY